ncbi:DoxX family protein [Williamsia herbipolensis]|uniref:DoxX family protein n=1 Tax=Williamsia herbipolensis TaxID=1603258 RepID=UPI0005F88684|nr:DoxX family protein [Williamsia herbipolensis]
MSERDREQRPQGSSPYDEPTETFRMPQTPPPGPEGTSTGVHGYQPYRRDGGDTESHDDATTAIPAAAASSDTAHDSTAAEDTAPKTTAIPVDRDAFHREHNRRAAYADDDAVPTYRSDRVADRDLDDHDIDADDSQTRALDTTGRDELDDPVSDRRSRRFSRSGRRSDPERLGRDALDDELAAAQAARRRGTTDLGLLALRVAVGLIAMAHGAQKLFGWWNGPRLSGFEDFLLNAPNTNIGFSADAAKPLAIVGALSESLGGLMLVLGLLTPIAGSAVLGVMIIAATYKATLAGGVWFFASGSAGPGVEYELFLGIAAASIILAGPGRISLDFGRGWATRPFVGSVAWLVVGIAAPVAIWILFNGTNPFQSPGNPSTG